MRHSRQSSLYHRPAQSSLRSHSQISPPMNPAAQGSSNHTYRNAYTGIQPLRNSVDVGSQLRGTLLPVGSQFHVADHYLGEVRSTPQTHRHRAPGTTNMGPPNLQGAVSGTPRGTPKETPRVSRGHVDLRQPQNPPMRFSGVGLGPGLAGLGSSRHTMDSNGATNHESFSAPSISSRGTSFPT